jgi:thioredoxin-related protein
VFDATIPRFRDVDFQRLNTDDSGNSELVQRYHATSIPRLVFLDGSGAVLYNGGAPANPENFEQLIGRYR